MNEIIHICSSDSGLGSFKFAIKKKFIEGKKVIGNDDDLSNGPIACIRNLKDRIDWCKILFPEDYDDIPQYIESNYLKLYKGIESIGNEDIYIWYGRTGREMCGLLYILSLLPDKIENIYTIDISEMSFNTASGGRYTPRWLGEIHPKNLNQLTSIKKAVDLSRYRHLMNIWERLQKENSLLRIFDGKELVSVPEDYLDDFILKYTEETYRKSARTVGDVLGYNETPVTEQYIFWRLLELIKMGKVLYTGKLGVMREMEIKRI